MGLLHVEKEPAVSQNVGRLDHAGSLFVRREKTASARRKAIRIMLCNQHEGVSPTANVSMSAGHANRLRFLNMEPSLGSPSGALFGRRGLKHRCQFTPLHVSGMRAIHTNRTAARWSGGSHDAAESDALKSRGEAPIIYLGE